MNKIKVVFLLLIIISSCRTRKEASSEFNRYPKNSKELIKKINTKNPEWLSLKIKAEVKKDSSSISFTSFIRMKKDSAIWISLKDPVADLFEMYRVVLTEDSIYFMDRFKRRFFIKPISYVSRFTNVSISFDEIQRLITANPKIPNKRYRFKHEKEYSLTSKKELIKFTVDPLIFKINSGLIRHKENSLKFLYNDFTEKQGYFFPKSLFLEIEAVDRIQLKIDFLTVNINKKKHISFVIPTKYEEIEK